MRGRTALAIAKSNNGEDAWANVNGWFERDSVELSLFEAEGRSEATINNPSTSGRQMNRPTSEEVANRK
jgi:hypothetical protein